jgi:hypothetical protein
VAGEEMNARGPCSSCGAQLAIDQRYCVECGQRVGPPLALPYALPASVGEQPAATGWLSALPVPVQTASIFAALALGFGVVVGTAISPNLNSILASPGGPSVVVEQPSTQSPTAGAGGGGSGPAAPAPAPSPVAVASAPTFPASSGGGAAGGGGGHHRQKKKKKSAATPTTFSGTVVRANPVGQSYTISTTNGLIAVHADTLPKVGDQVESDVRSLANGTYAENSRTPTGTADVASFHGTVTYCADLERPAAACDGSSAADHYVYAVSSLGASVLVSWAHSAANPPPGIGAQVQVAVKIGDPFQPVEPDAWATDESCTPAYDEQNGLPHDALKLPELTQTSLNVTGQATTATAEAVVQTVCPGNSPKLVLSADDVREAGRDLGELAVPSGIDLGRLSPGEAVQLAIDVADGGGLALEGITSDQGTAGANDPSQGQGSLAGS